MTYTKRVLGSPVRPPRTRRSRIWWVLVAGAIVPATAVVEVPAQENRVIQVWADAHVSAEQPRTSWPVNRTLRAGTAARRLAYLRFRIGDEPLGPARLDLFARAESSGSFRVHLTTGGWKEATLRFATAPPVGEFVAEATASGEGWISLDLGDVAAGKRWLNLVVTALGSSDVRFGSGESSARPQLVDVTPAPEPTPSDSQPEPSPTDPGPQPSPTEPSPEPTRTDSTSVVVAAAGDIACDPGNPNFNATNGANNVCQMRATSDAILAMNPDAVLVLGDLQYENGTLPKFQQSYDPTWGRFKHKSRPVPGNHEYHTSGAAGYFDYFGAAAGDRTTGYYSFDLGAWHIVALNSECGQVGGCGAGSPQEQWLRADLAATSKMCVLAMWHHPRFSSGRPSATYAAFWDALYDAGAEIVLGGHDHFYERFAPQTSSGIRDDARGLRQFVVGTGGVNLVPFGTPLANSEVRNAATYGALKLTLSASAYAWEFTPAAGGSFQDAGTETCH